MKIVSLIASATEIVCALGFEKDLVGRSHECDFPPSVKILPVCTEPKFGVDGSSAEIDARVKKILQDKDALSVYRVDEKLLARLKPDFIVTQSQCEVCAVSFKDVEAAVSRSTGIVAKIVSLQPNALADVYDDIERVATALSATERSRALNASMKSRLAVIHKKAAERAPKPAVACIEWIEPLMAAGNWMPEIVTLAGGLNLFGEAGRHSPQMAWGDLRAKDPDIIVVMPCGFDIARTRSEMPCLTRLKGWDRLKAVCDRRVVLADGNQYFNRPGPRLVESLEILAEIFHPQTFRFGHEGAGWQRL